MQNLLKDLKLYYLNPLKIENAEITNQCYLLWRSVWKKTFFDLDGEKNLFSDDFSRQDELIALYYKGAPIALVMHRYCQWSLAYLVHDSYFKSWPVTALQHLVQAGPRVVIGSQITISPEFRKTSDFSLPIKELIVNASLQHLKNQSHAIDAITGTVRADKGVHKLFYQSGAECLESDVMFHNVPVDLVAFFPQRREILISKEMEMILNRINKFEGVQNEYSRTA